MAVEIQTMPGLNGHPNGDVDMDAAVKDGVLRFTSGIILPPPEIKCKSCLVTICSIQCIHYIDLLTAVIDRTALFVARSANPPQFEDKIRENQRSDPKFSFLNPADPYHAYYRQRMEKIAQGDLGDEATPDKGGKMEEGEGKAETMAVDNGQEPPAPEFIMDLPNISSIDL